MIILSNGFPTNMPDSENVSQGGPANFAKLFSSYLAEHQTKEKNSWIGLMFQITGSNKPELETTYKFTGRSYYKLYFPKNQLKKVTKAAQPVDPLKILNSSIRLLVELMREKKPDLVFLNGFGVFNWMLLKAAEEAGIPAVIQHAGIWTKELNIHKSTYSAAGLTIMKKMEKDSSRLTAAEIFLNTWSRDYYHRQVAKRKDNHNYIIPLPFNFSNFKKLSTANNESQFYFDQKKLQIGVIARWDDIKNHKLILSLAKTINRKKLPWQIHTITNIPDLPRYQKIKDEYEKYIDVIAPTDRSGISDFCHSVDLIIQPSIFDVSPTVVLEAIALDTPIAISQHVGYVADFRKYGASKWVLDNAAASIIEQIKKIARKEMPANLKKYLKDAHRHKKVFAAYLKLFKKISAKDKKGTNKK